MRGAGNQFGLRARRTPTKDALQKKWPVGTAVWFYRSTDAGPVRVLGVLDAHDTKNVDWIVRTATGRNVRVPPLKLHRTIRGKAV